MRRCGFTRRELAVIIAVIVILVLILLPVLAKSREAAGRAACQDNMKQMSIVFAMYADESPGGRFPKAGRSLAAIDGPALYPDYMTDDKLIVCPADREAVALLDSGGPDDVGYWYELDSNGNRVVNPNRFAALSYLYMGWVTEDAGHLENIAGILRAHGATSDGGVDQPIKDGDLDTTSPGGLGPGTGNGGGNKIYRIVDGFEGGSSLLMSAEFLTKVDAYPARSTIPVLFDTVSTTIRDFNHASGGVNVLYADWHVEFVQYPAKYPVSAKAATVIESLDF